jgi:hypothetical protein
MAEELGVKSFLWLQDNLSYWFRALSTGALGYWVYTYFTNSKYSFTYHSFLSGFQPNQFVINLERSAKAENHDISKEQLGKIDFFLRISAESAMVAQATKEKSFSLGTPTMFDSAKDISYHQYHTALTKRMSNLFSYVNSYPLSLEEKANIERILSQWDIIYENIPADFLYIVQTQCIHALSCPMLDWNRKLYLKEVYTFIKKFELIEDKKKFNKQSKILFELMLNYINIDIDDQIEVLLDSEDGFSCIELVELTKKGDS